jgi:hypothetical protein
MLNLRLARPMLIALAACAANIFVQGSALADDAQENKALKEQMRQMMQRMDALQKQVEALSRQQAATPPPAVVAAPPPPPPPVYTPPPAQVAGPPVVAKAAEQEPLFKKFLSGFYGTLDVSLDDATKGISGPHRLLVLVCRRGTPGTGYVNNGPKGTQITGSVGWLGDLSTNKSVLGYRGSHTIAGSDVDFIYQIETQPSITSSPGLNTSYTQQSNVVKGAIGYGDTYVGVQNKDWGKIKSAPPMHPTSPRPTG